MLASTATIERRVAILQRQVAELRQVRQAESRPPKSAVELASTAGLALDPWQERALTTDARDVILLASRQAGKSTVAGIAALHQSLTVPGSLSLVVSPSERQSKRLLRAIRQLYHRLPETVPARHLGIIALEFANGSEIHALPGSEETIRGFSAVALLVLDEGARIDDPLYESVRPMLAVSNGKLMALSTPAGKRGWFHNEWESGEGWHRERVIATEVPRIDPAWLRRERERIGAFAYRQEYLTEFLQDDDAYFDYDAIHRALRPDPEPWFVGERVLAS